MISKKLYSMFAQQNKKEHLTIEEQKKWNAVDTYIKQLFNEAGAPSQQNIQELKNILIKLQTQHFYNMGEIDKDVVKSSKLAFDVLQDFNITNKENPQIKAMSAILNWVVTGEQDNAEKTSNSSRVIQSLELLHKNINESKATTSDGKPLKSFFTIDPNDPSIPKIIKTASKHVYGDNANYIYIINKNAITPDSIFELDTLTKLAINNKLKSKPTTTTPENEITPEGMEASANTTNPIIPNDTTKPVSPVDITPAPVKKTIKENKPAFNLYKKSLVLIDSKYRYNYNSTLSNNYFYYLSNTFNNVKEIKIIQTFIKDTSYNVNNNNNHLRMNIHVTDVKRPTDIIQNIIIPKGNYFQNKTDTDTNLDAHIQNLFGLYEEFKNMSIYFNYKNNKYYFYQNYAYLLTEHSHMYNIFFNFGKIDQIMDQEIKFSTNNDKRLITETTTAKIAEFSNLNTTNTLKKSVLIENKQFLNNSIGKYLGFYPNTYSTHVSNFVKVSYFQDNNLVDSSGNNYNILQFNITQSETLFNKIYDMLILAKEDMFIGFVLENPLDNNNCKHAILKLEPNFCSNVITHRSNPTNVDLFGVPIAPIEFTIEIYLTKKLHQFPKFNRLLTPELINNNTPTIFSNTIILPVVSDRPYELRNDNYMLLHLSLNGKKLPRLETSDEAPEALQDAFTQFRTETDNDFFVNSIDTTPHIFTNGKNINSFHIELYDKNNNLIDLNNSDHSFVVELTHLNPQPKKT
tara:strand:+ start:1396 stop:3621 length:2226 start_codon:yes stop_codon:yes gene_type:complete